MPSLLVITEKHTEMFRYCLKYVLAPLVLAACAGMAEAREWVTDILGAPFEMSYIDQGTDYSGPVRSTAVRLTGSGAAGNAGALYVHGFNDYFFQKEMAAEFAGHGYAFYAVDLRKYGRSLMPGQKPFQVRDLREYFADIDSALNVMRDDGVERIVLCGHSTGGLITTLYMRYRATPDIKALVLNSPFLDWNQSKLQERILVPVVRTLSPFMRNLPIPQSESTEYSHSLLKRYGGEWEYDTCLKFTVSPPVDPAWIAAIDEAQDVVQNAPRLTVPVLVLHSDRTLQPGDTPGTASHSDAVLDVTDIDYYGRRLGYNVTVATVHGGVHDLLLSAPAVREALYTYLFSWLWGTCPPVRLPGASAE